MLLVLAPAAGTYYYSTVPDNRNADSTCNCILFCHFARDWETLEENPCPEDEKPWGLCPGCCKKLAWPGCLLLDWSRLDSLVCLTIKRNGTQERSMDAFNAMHEV